MKFIKKVRTLVTLLLVVAILVGIPRIYSLHASAANAVTYAVKYVPSLKEWRYQDNTSTFNDSAYHRELYYLRLALKDGDLVVVYNDSESVPSLDLGTARLSNLTVTNLASFAVIFCGDIDDCYLLGGASCSINADVTNAYVYDTVLCNFNKNVKELNIYPQGGVTSTLGCAGTVDHVFASSRSTGNALYSYYNFPEGSFLIQSGILMTDKSKYSVTANVVSKALTAENFDYERYANDYPDLKAAFGLNAAALYNHYTTFGIKEKRVAYTKVNTTEFDYVRYANDYPDLKAAFGYDATALYNHYITYGIAEKRGDYTVSAAYDSFDYVRYANDYADVKAAFGYDAAALYKHYTTYGIAEGRGNYYK